jgi:hypothetical protein
MIAMRSTTTVTAISKSVSESLLNMAGTSVNCLSLRPHFIPLNIARYKSIYVLCFTWRCDSDMGHRVLMLIESMGYRKARDWGRILKIEG